MNEQTRDGREQPQPINYGIKPEHLSQVIGKVGELYTEVSGHEFRDYERHLLDSASLLEKLKLNGNIEYRFGSILTMHSKLWIQMGAGLLRFRFDANMPVDSPRYITEGRAMEERFKTEINRFLLEVGIAEPLPSYYG